MEFEPAAPQTLGVEHCVQAVVAEPLAARQLPRSQMVKRADTGERREEEGEVGCVAVLT